MINLNLSGRADAEGRENRPAQPSRPAGFAGAGDCRRTLNAEAASGCDCVTGGETCY